jgi:hypothetical protein
VGSFLPDKFDPVEIGTAATDIGTTPNDTLDVTIHIRVSNRNNSDRFVRMWIYPAGGGAGNANHILWEHPVRGKSILPIKDTFVLKAGDTLAAACVGAGADASSLTVSTSLARKSLA